MLFGTTIISTSDALVAGGAAAAAVACFCGIKFTTLRTVKLRWFKMPEFRIGKVLVVGLSTMVFGVLICVSPTRIIFLTVVLSESTFITIGLYFVCGVLADALVFGDDLTIVLFTISTLLPGRNDVCLKTGCVVVAVVVMFEVALATVRSLLFMVDMGLGVETSTLVYFNGGIERNEPGDVVTGFT